METLQHTKHAVLILHGATCTSCTFAVEHFGERLNGIEDIWVDKEHSCIRVDYNGDVSLLEQICEFVKKIGYEASISDSDV